MYVFVSFILRFSLLIVLLLGAPAVSSAADAGTPRGNYLLHCSGCHGIDGYGAVKAGIPSLRSAPGYFLHLQEGRHYLVQVPGVAESTLTHAQAAELLNWVIKTWSPKEAPPNWMPYTATEIAKLHKEKVADIPGFRSKVIEQLSARGIDVYTVSP